MLVMARPWVMTRNAPSKVSFTARVSTSATAFSFAISTPFKAPMQAPVRKMTSMAITAGQPFSSSRSPHVAENDITPSRDRSIKPSMIAKAWAKERIPSTVACERTFPKIVGLKKLGSRPPTTATARTSRIQTILFSNFLFNLNQFIFTFIPPCLIHSQTAAFNPQNHQQ